MVRKSDLSMLLMKDGEEFPEKSKINCSHIRAIFLCLVVVVGLGILLGSIGRGSGEDLNVKGIANKIKEIYDVLCKDSLCNKNFSSHF